jgi:hypothetical protein
MWVVCSSGSRTVTRSDWRNWERMASLAWARRPDLQPRSPQRYQVELNEPPRSHLFAGTYGITSAKGRARQSPPACTVPSPHLPHLRVGKIPMHWRTRRFSGRRSGPFVAGLRECGASGARHWSRSGGRVACLPGEQAGRMPAPPDRHPEASRPAVFRTCRCGWQSGDTHGFQTCHHA